MKKIGRGRSAGFHQMCITMKLITLLLTVVLMEAHGGGIAQNVSLSGQHLSLKKIFSEIKQQTGYAFFYNYSLLREAHPVSLDVKDAPLVRVLDLCFQGQPLDYSIENRTIVITKKAAAATGLAVIAPLVANRTDPGLPESIVIKGRITNEKGEPVVGATVKVKGEKIGTATDGDGNFSIRVPAHSVLVISSVGYQSKEITVGREETLNIQLKLGDKTIDEVVVTGFGESRAKRGLGYSVTQISGDQIREANAINPIVALQGMVPGLQVQPGVSGPSASPKFLIRGSSSLDPYGNTPLVVLDGVILDNQSVLPNTGGGADFGNILKDINPDDIESLSVLKGGAVTALYGSRAANGVILIKTKRGYKSKGIGVSFAHSDYVDHPYKILDYQNQFGSGVGINDWDTLSNGKLAIDDNTYGLSFGPPIAGQTYLDRSGQTIKNVANNPLMLYRNGLTDNTNLALNTAGDHSTFRLSYSNLTSNGISPSNQLKRNSIQLRVTENLNEKISVDAGASYVQSGSWNPALQGGNSPLYSLGYNTARNYDLPYWSTHYTDSLNGGQNNNDELGQAQSIFFPLFENNQYLLEDNFRGSVQTVVHILPWMDFQGNVNANIYNRNITTDQRGTNQHFGNPYYATSSSLLDQFRYNGSLFFRRTFNKDWVATLQTGGEVFTSLIKGSSAHTNGSILPDVYRLSNSQQLPTVTENAPNSSQTGSLFYQGSIQYKGMYFLNIYGRNDWNSTLVYNDGHGTYSYFYPGADFSWIFTDAIPNFPKVFNFGKLRFSYDRNGNGTDPYTANTGGYNTSGPYQTAGNVTVNPFGYSSNTLPNNHLVPEQSSKFETGLEFKMLHNRLGADITFYTQDTKNQIISFGVPIYSGVSSALLNGGVVRNRGLEIMLTGTPVKLKNFTWNSQFNYTLNRNKVLSLPLGANYQSLEGGGGIRTVAISGGDYGLLVGQNAYARYQATDANGNNVASPLNGQHVITADPSGTFPSYVRATDYGTTPNTKNPVVGTTLPKFLGSWQNSFTYKQFSLSIFLDSRFGGLEWSQTIQYATEVGSLKSSLPGRNNALGGVSYTPLPNSATYFPGYVNSTSRQDGILLKGVFQQGASTMGQDNQMHNVGGMTFADAYKKGYVQPLDAPDYYINTYDYFAGITEAATFKSDWIVVRDISLGYELPSKWAAKAKMNSLRAIISVRNPFYLYNNAQDHINPDNQNDTGSGNAFDGGGIPYIRTYGFSINGNF
jgi:iron complex outermembrane recepter protein